MKLSEIQVKITPDISNWVQNNMPLNDESYEAIHSIGENLASSGRAIATFANAGTIYLTPQNSQSVEWTNPPFKMRFDSPCRGVDIDGYNLNGISFDWFEGGHCLSLHCRSDPIGDALTKLHTIKNVDSFYASFNIHTLKGGLLEAADSGIPEIELWAGNENATALFTIKVIQGNFMLKNVRKRDEHGKLVGAPLQFRCNDVFSMQEALIECGYGDFI
ncbi:hypothetical protein RsoM2USA_327 [Ralstonia phage RsoM2USA]|nr:hypothetical protein RsoM2USA_327 [Ralstonia phage RsoM2USA]